MYKRQRLKILTSTFMFPLLKQLDAHLNSQDVVVLCPKTALALIASELAGWKEHPLPQMTTYTEALFSLQKQIRFCGQTCINPVSYTHLFGSHPICMTLYPIPDSAAERFDVVVDFPIPPLP